MSRPTPIPAMNDSTSLMPVSGSSVGTSVTTSGIVVVLSPGTVVVTMVVDGVVVVEVRAVEVVVVLAIGTVVVDVGGTVVVGGNTVVVVTTDVVVVLCGGCDLRQWLTVSTFLLSIQCIPPSHGRFSDPLPCHTWRAV